MKQIAFLRCFLAENRVLVDYTHRTDGKKVGTDRLTAHGALCIRCKTKYRISEHTRAYL